MVGFGDSASDPGSTPGISTFMLPLRVCFLWHFHQPDYTVPGSEDGHRKLFLPWVRMHALKDYVWLPRLFAEFSLRHTINVVPSLLDQIEAYDRGATDPVLELCRGPVSDRSPEDRRLLVEWASTLQPTTQLHEFPRLVLLLQHPQPERLSDAELLDLQTLLHLAWSSPELRRQPIIANLTNKQHGFSQTERDRLLDVQHVYLQEVIPALKQLCAVTGSEVSVSPFYHPILPLLCSTATARESMPEAYLPNPPLQARADAQWHVASALADATTRFGSRPQGMWPSEGSLSMDVLTIMAEQGIRWTATDAAILRQSQLAQGHERQSPAPTAPYHPYRVTTSSGDITVLFRDLELSDAIGFVYATWDPDRAAEDFLTRLRHRRAMIIDHEGIEALTSACVPVILDGENCWEFYHGNGEPFLRALLRRLSDADDIQLVTCSEAAAASAPYLDHLVAGSWIDGNFRIWIGSPATNLAWELLADVRKNLPEAFYPELYRLEASDWWWWYDQRHTAPHQWLFDRMFRRHLVRLYELSHRHPPVNLDHPLQDIAMKQSTDSSEKHLVPVGFSAGAMHQGESLCKHLMVETDENWQRITIELNRPCHGDEEVIATIRDRHGLERRCGITADEVLFQSPLHDEGCQRLSAMHAAVYVRTADHWWVEIQEQRTGGRLASTRVEVRL